MDKQQEQRRHCWKDELVHIDHSLQFEVEMAPAVLRGEEGVWMRKGRGMDLYGGKEKSWVGSRMQRGLGWKDAI